jgi:hypothetical protein
MKFKKFMAGLLALATVSSIGALGAAADDTLGLSDGVGTYPIEPGTYLVGDVSNDGNIRVNDIQITRQVLLHQADFTYGDIILKNADQNRLADANQDGSVRVNDVQTVRQLLLHQVDTLGEFTIYAEDVLGKEDALPSLDEVDNVADVSDEQVATIADNVLDALTEYSKLTDEQKEEVSSEELATAIVDKTETLVETLQGLTDSDLTVTEDVEELEAVADTVEAIIESYEEKKAEGATKEEIIEQATQLVTDNGLTIEANDQAYLTSVFAQAKEVYTANDGEISAEQLLAIVNALKY